MTTMAFGLGKPSPCQKLSSFKPVLEGVTSVALLITVHEQTHLKSVIFISLKYSLLPKDITFRTYSYGLTFY